MGINCQNCNAYLKDCEFVEICNKCGSINMHQHKWISPREVENWCKTTMNCDKFCYKNSSDGKKYLYCTFFNLVGFKAVFPCMRKAKLNNDIKIQKSLMDY